MNEAGQITRPYALAKARDLRSIADMMDGGADYSRQDSSERQSGDNLAQRLRQAAFALEMTAPRDTSTDAQRESAE